MAFYTYNGQLLKVGGQLAVNEDCCCETEPCDDVEVGCCCFGSFEGSTETLTSFGITECDCDLMGGTWKADCEECDENDGYGDNDDSTAPAGKCNICKTVTIQYDSYEVRPLEYDNEDLCDNSCPFMGSPNDCVDDPGNTNCADSFPGFPGVLSGVLTCYCEDCGAGSECFANCHLNTIMTVTVTFQVQSGPCTFFSQSSSSGTVPLVCGCGDGIQNSTSIVITTQVAQINSGTSYSYSGTSTTKDKLSGECSGLSLTSTPVSGTLTCP